jgi:diacylglycerol kinase
MFGGVLKRLNYIHWYHGALSIFVPILTLSLTMQLQIPNYIVLTGSCGLILISIGEWINHASETVVQNSFKYTVKNRVNTFFGNSFDITGVLVIFSGIFYAVLISMDGL